MGKHKGFDVIAEAHERAEHNINPYYWVNRVTNFSVAQWMAEKKLALIFAPLNLILFIVIVWNLPGAFSNGFSWQDLGALLVLGFITLAEVIMAAQWWQSHRKRLMESDSSEKKRKKKQPRRRKDYQ